MTEQNEKTTQTDQLADDDAMIYNRIYIIGAVAGIFTALLALVLYFTEFKASSPPQLLAYAGTLAASIIILFASRYFYFQGKTRLAETLIPAAVFVAFGLTNLSVSGLELLLGISGLIILVITSYTLKATVPSWWIINGVIFAIFHLLLYFLPPANRFDITQSSFWITFISTIIAGMIIAIVWQLALSLRYTSLQTRLLISFVAITIIPVAIAVIAGANISIQNGNDQVLANLATSSKNNVEKINTWLNTLQQQFIFDQEFHQELITFEFGNPEPEVKDQAYNDLANELQYLANPVSGFTPYFSKTFILDPNGQVLISTEESIEGEDHSSNLYYTESVNLENYTSSLSFSAFGEIELFLSIPILDQSNNLLGILVGKANPNILIDIMANNTLLEGNGFSYLIDSTGRVITYIGTTSIFPFIESVPVSNVLASHASGNELYDNKNNEVILVAYDWIPTLEIGLITEIQSDLALQSIINDQVIILSISLLAITIALVSAIIISRNIANPLSTLLINSIGFSNKTLNNIPTIDRTDEIGKLSQVLKKISLNMQDVTGNVESIVEERIKDIKDRSSRIETAALIGQAASSVEDLEELLTTASHLINENLSYYHVGIYLLDNAGEYAVLKATNSEGGWRMISGDHKVKVGAEGIVGFVTGSGEARIKQSSDGSDVYYDNQDLPLTRSQITIPLFQNEVVIGALDIQSTEESAFNEEDTQDLEVLANQISSAIESTQRFVSLQTTLDAERLVHNALNRESWTNVVTQELFGYTSNAAGTRIADDTELQSTTKDAVNLGQTIVTEENEELYKIAIPVKVRGDQTVAVIETEKTIDQGEWNSGEIQVLEAIAEQLGITLENARLFEQTQNLAKRERIAADVSGKVWSSSDINTILQTAVQELGKALNASEGTIRLRLPDDEE